VRRPTGGIKSAVLAVPEEIDAWVRSLKSEENQKRETLIQSLRIENQRLRQELKRARVR
jgi:hypothetical protein